MNLWIGDYLELSNEIHYLKFKLTDDQLTTKQHKETQLKLDKRLKRENEFKVIINSFEDLESKILKMKYIEGMTLSKIAEELGYNYNYIANEHAAIMKIIKKFDVIYSNLEEHIKNQSR